MFDENWRGGGVGGRRRDREIKRVRKINRVHFIY